MRFMRTIIDGIRAEVPGLLIGVRLSAFDMVPFRKRGDGVGEPDPDGRRPCRSWLRADAAGGEASLDDATAVLSALEQLRRPVDLHHGGQPVLQPAHAAAGALSRRSTATCRPKIRCAAWRGRSRRRRG